MPAPLKLDIVLVGCGHMGRAMLEGWITSGIISTCYIVDPSLQNPPTESYIKALKNTDHLPDTVDVVVFAVKPQIIKSVLPEYQNIMKNAVGLSIAAGTSLATFEDHLGADIPMVRAMPNTPAAIGKGATGLYANSNVNDRSRDMIDLLLKPLGLTLWLENEDQLNDVTALSGSGPAYIFHMIEAMAAAGEKLGLADDVAMALARQTVIGAASLAESTPHITANNLRENVTSPNGTTEAGLNVLMDDKDGLKDLMRRTLKAAALRARELSKE